MLQVFFGTDTVAVREQAQAYLATFRDPVIISRIECSSYESGSVENTLGTTSLFGETLVYVFDSPQELVDFKAEVDACIALLSEAPIEYILLMHGLTATEKKRFTSVGAVLHEFTTASQARDNTFAITEALARKDKKALWLFYQEAVRAGKSAEEIIGLLWWQLKALRLAYLTHTASEASMKDFPYRKAKQALKHFKAGEVEALSNSLLQVYHDGHAGTSDIDLGLEAWILRVK
jgi:DNA polymerase III delta subunit